MKGELLETLADQRLELLDEVINADKEYQFARKEQIEVQERLETMGLTDEQKAMLQKLLAMANQNSAIYGKIAYMQGVRDGAEFMCELKAKNESVFHVL